MSRMSHSICLAQAQLSGYYLVFNAHTLCHSSDIAHGLWIAAMMCAVFSDLDRVGMCCL